MTIESRKAAQYTKGKSKLFKLLNDFMMSEEFHQNDPVWQKAVEIGRSKHLPITEAMRLAEQEFKNK